MTNVNIIIVIHFMIVKSPHLIKKKRISMIDIILIIIENWEKTCI